MIAASACSRRAVPARRNNRPRHSNRRRGRHRGNSRISSRDSSRRTRRVSRRRSSKVSHRRSSRASRHRSSKATARRHRIRRARRIRTASPHRTRTRRRVARSRTASRRSNRRTPRSTRRVQPWRRSPHQAARSPARVSSSASPSRPIPHFIFDISYTATLSYGCLAIDTGANPTRCEPSASFDVAPEIINHYDFLLPNNLAANQGYYWRSVSAPALHFSNAKWSETNSFKAGPQVGYLPAPSLYSPPNYSTVTLFYPGGATLTWYAVSGAAAYDIEVRDTVSNTWTSYTSSTNQLNCTNCFQPNKQYMWTVQARDNNAWGYKSGIFLFLYQIITGSRKLLVNNLACFSNNKHDSSAI